MDRQQTFEQFTHFGTLQEDGHKVPNDANQSLDSSITQLLLGYNFNERFGLQVSVPIIHRSFLSPRWWRGISASSLPIEARSC